MEKIKSTFKRVTKSILSKNKKKQICGSVRIKSSRSGVIFWTKPSFLSIFFLSLSITLVIFALVSASVPIIPLIWYRINPNASRAMAQILSRPAVTFGDLLAASGNRELMNYQPPLDTSLPKTNILRIPKIGVETEILEEKAENYEEALKKGVWRVPDFGTPFLRRFPTILVAHRFGYLSWSNDYRRKHSFFNLPKISPGDQVEIIWEQRKYTYEIYGGDENEVLTDYTADLILYTCQFLESDVRIFRYAKLIIPQ